jgi:hypothetical protein
MLETSTNGAGAADDAAAGREDQGGVAELGFVAGGCAAPGVPGPAAPAEVPDPELVEQAKRRKFTAMVGHNGSRRILRCSWPQADQRHSSQPLIPWPLDAILE